VPKRSNNDKQTFKVCKFVDYAPNVFLKIRHIFNIKSEEYLRSIGPETLL
jgi:1-phosphatidylinositol-4-phosphate 5-kinase